MTKWSFVTTALDCFHRVQQSSMRHSEFMDMLNNLSVDLVLNDILKGLIFLLREERCLKVTIVTRDSQEPVSVNKAEFELPHDSADFSNQHSSFRRGITVDEFLTRREYCFQTFPVMLDRETQGSIVAVSDILDKEDPVVQNLMTIISGIVTLHLSKLNLASLHENDIVLETIFELSSDLLWIQDEEHRFIRVNRAFLRAVRRAHNQVVERRPEDFLLPKQAQALREILDRSRHNGPSSSGEPIHLSENKDEAYTISIAPVSGSASKRKFVGIARNISRLMRLRNERTRLLELLGRAVFRASFFSRTDHRLRLSLTRECATMISSFLYQNYRPFDASFLSHIRFAVYFYDMGMLTIDRSVLLKESPLNEDEWNSVLKHPEKGGELIDALMKEQGWNHPGLEFSKEVARNHHERYNGSGYPKGLKSDRIPLSARIMAVCDSYAAMRAPRPYTHKRSHLEAAKTIREASGKAFDPLVVEAFLEIEAHIESLSERFVDNRDLPEGFF